jgi:regulatory protein
MKVTKLKPSVRRPGFVSVFVDGARLGSLPIEEVRRLRLEVGAELSDELAEELKLAVDRARAYSAAVRLLAVRGRAVQEIIARLRRKGIRADAVDHAVGRLESEGLLNDAAFAREFARSRAARGYGRARILADLSAKGIARRDAERAAAQAEDDDENSGGKLLALAQKRALQLRGLERAVARRRLVGYLARRGYGGGDVWSVVNEVLDHEGRDEPVP